MNSHQKKLCIILAIFFFTVGVIFLQDGENLTGVLSMGMSGACLFLFLGAKGQKTITESDKVFIRDYINSHRLKTPLKVLVITIICFALLATCLEFIRNWKQTAQSDRFLTDADFIDSEQSK